MATVTNASPNGTYSLGLSGRIGLYGTTNDTDAHLVDFGAGTSTRFNAGVSGGVTVNCSGTIGVCGGVNSQTVALFDLSSRLQRSWAV